MLLPVGRTLRVGLSAAIAMMGEGDIYKMPLDDISNVSYGLPTANFFEKMEGSLSKKVYAATPAKRLTIKFKGLR